jgi:hypothetical protein
MADVSGGSRAVWMTLIGVVAFGAGAATVSLLTWTTAPSAGPVEGPGRPPMEAAKEELRKSYDKIADAQKDLQRRLEQSDRDLEAARARIAELESAVAPDKTKPAPGAKPGAGAVDAHESVVQAVDNKNDIYVISTGTKEGVEQGMEFEVRRGGEAIGSIVIDKVFPNYASGFRKPGSKAFDASAGDVCVRVTSGK